VTPPPFRCSFCGSDNVKPGPLVYTDSDRYAIGTCKWCFSVARQLIRAATIEEATKGIHAIREEKAAKKAAKKALAEAMRTNREIEP